MDNKYKKENKDLIYDKTNQMKIGKNEFSSQPNYNYQNNESKILENLSYKEIEALKEKNRWFFFEYSKLLEKNKFLNIQLRELVKKKKKFHNYINKLNCQIKNGNRNNQENIKNNNINFDNDSTLLSNIFINRKRKRRKKREIVYKYSCNYKNCNKIYSTDGALTQNIKFKHL